tara:strand:- start:526 stop:948 length:423 start_codon:yes stop_codon:yes gene_type:complete
MLRIREILVEDYEIMIKLLTQLTECTCSKEQFNNYIQSLPKNEYIYILESNDSVVATGKLVIETKIIRGLRSVGHIEDIVVDENSRGNGFGKILVNYLTATAENLGCYKVILDCDQSLARFYESCDLIYKGIQMAKYFNE